ncbi:GNAT family N-acetyltransferase [Candidatus Roizmanbacteria bacterium]|jgi:hypothetical protein|nr:GNAT family N-acetyltransferase [Candidatus Roizmanbacteria bacterium]
MSDKLEWLPFQASDLEDVNKIADRIHTSLPERPEVFEEKVMLFPQGCRKLVLNHKIVGYGITHPWVLYSIPPLDDFLRALPEPPQCLYIHDVVVLPEARGHRAAELYVDYIKLLAKKMAISSLALVSVYGTDVLWCRYGFQVSKDSIIANKLASYGESAKYMVCNLL